MKKLFLLFSVSLGLCGSAPAVLAGSTTARVTITPTLCVVDVVQDGNNQVITTPSSDCKAALPNLLPVPEPEHSAANPLFALPFAGPNNSPPIIQFRQESVWTPLVSKEQEGTTTQPASRLSVVASGLVVVAIASALGVDMALFEMRYSRSLVRWLYGKSFGRFAKQ